MSVTDFLEKARAGIQDTNPSVQPAGSKSIFNLDDVAAITVRYQKSSDPSNLSDTSIPPFLLTGIGRIAFGSFQSPGFLNERFIIPATPTATAIAAPLTTSQIYFHVFLPKTAKPAGGYPVVIVATASETTASAFPPQPPRHSRAPDSPVSPSTCSAMATGPAASKHHGKPEP